MGDCESQNGPGKESCDDTALNSSLVMTPFRSVTSSRVLVAASGVAAATAVGALTPVIPSILLVCCVAAAAAMAVRSSSGRFAIVISGGLLVFRSSDQLDVTKIAYLLWVAVSTAVAVVKLGADRDHDRLNDIRPLVLSAVALAAAIVLSLAVALVSGTSFIDWLRDAAPYCLLVVAPFLAWDSVRSRLSSHLEVIIVASGLMASVAFAVEWLGRRGLADLPFATLGSSSGMLSGLAFIVAIGAVLSGGRRAIVWAAIAATIITLLLITGTRSAVVLLVGPIAMMFEPGKRLTRARRLAGAFVVVGLAMLALTFIALQSGIIDVLRLSQRLGSIAGLGTDLSNDQSFIERLAQAETVSSTFANSPLFGVGLGHAFAFVRFAGNVTSEFTVDTGLSLAAKFGLAGLGLLAVAASSSFVFFRRLRPRLSEHIRLSFIGFAAVALATLPLGNPLEDKGFGLAATLLVAWALSSAEKSVTTATLAHVRPPPRGPVHP